MYQPKECPKCASVYCFECNNNDISKKGKWFCKECQAAEPLVDLHRTVKEVLEKLVFSCPKCAEVKRTYNEIHTHMNNCAGADI